MARTASLLQTLTAILGATLRASVLLRATLRLLVLPSAVLVFRLILKAMLSFLLLLQAARMMLMFCRLLFFRMFLEAPVLLRKAPNFQVLFSWALSYAPYNVAREEISGSAILMAYLSAHRVTRACIAKRSSSGFSRGTASRTRSCSSKSASSRRSATGLSGSARSKLPGRRCGERASARILRPVGPGRIQHVVANFAAGGA